MMKNLTFLVLAIQLLSFNAIALDIIEYGNSERRFKALAPLKRVSANASGEYAFTLNEQIGHTFRNEIIHYRLEGLPKAETSKWSLLDQKNQSLPFQLVQRPDHVQLWLKVDLLKPHQKLSYRLVRKPSKVQSTLLMKENSRYLEITNGRTGVRVPKSARLSSEVPGPILGLLSVEERKWIGSSRLDLSKGKVKRIESRVTLQGPIRAVASVRYLFDNPEHFYQLDIELTKDANHLRLIEQGRVPGADDKLFISFPDWKPDHGVINTRMGASSYIQKGNLNGYLRSLRPWNGAASSFYGMYRNGGKDFLSVIPSMPGYWLPSHHTTRISNANKGYPEIETYLNGDFHALHLVFTDARRAIRLTRVPKGYPGDGGQIGNKRALGRKIRVEHTKLPGKYNPTLAKGEIGPLMKEQIRLKVEAKKAVDTQSVALKESGVEGLDLDDSVTEKDPTLVEADKVAEAPDSIDQVPSGYEGLDRDAAAGYMYFISEFRPQVLAGSADPWFYRLKLNDLPLDKIKDWVLTHDDKELEWPRIHGSRKDWSRIRKEVLPLTDPYRKNYYAVSQIVKGSKIDILKELERNETLKNWDYVRSHWESTWRVDLTVQSILYRGFASTPYILTSGQSLYSAVRATDTFKPSLTPKQWQSWKKWALTMAYILRDRDYHWYDWRKEGLGTNYLPNFNTTQWTGLGELAIMLPNHPQAKEWLSFARWSLEKELTHHIDDEGAGEENPGNYYPFAYSMFVPFMIAMQQHGIADYSSHPRVQAMAKFWIQIATPPDPRMNNRRIVPRIGHHPGIAAEECPPLAWMSLLLQKSNPKLAGEAMWMWDQQKQRVGGRQSLPTGLYLIHPNLPRSKPELESRTLGRLGYVFRNHAGTDHETYFCLKAGPLFSHFDNDHGSFSFYANGLPLSFDGMDGSSTRASSASDHNVVTVAGRGSRTGKLLKTRFSASADYGLCESDAQYPIKRHALLVKGKSLKDPDYIVLYDEVSAPGTATWNIDVHSGKPLSFDKQPLEDKALQRHLAKNTTTIKASISIDDANHAGLGVDTTRVEEESEAIDELMELAEEEDQPKAKVGFPGVTFPYFTMDKTYTSGLNCFIVEPRDANATLARGFIDKTYPYGLSTKERWFARVQAKANQNFLTVLMPHKSGSKTVKVMPTEHPKAFEVVYAGGRDIVIASPKSIEVKLKNIHFKGKMGVLRLGTDTQVLNLIDGSFFSYNKHQLKEPGEINLAKLTAGVNP